MLKCLSCVCKISDVELHLRQIGSQLNVVTNNWHQGLLLTIRRNNCTVVNAKIYTNQGNKDIFMPDWASKGDVQEKDKDNDGSKDNFGSNLLIDPSDYQEGYLQSQKGMAKPCRWRGEEYDVLDPKVIPGGFHILRTYKDDAWEEPYGRIRTNYAAG